MRASTAHSSSSRRRLLALALASALAAGAAAVTAPRAALAAGGAAKADAAAADAAGPAFLAVSEVIVPVAVRGRLGGYVIVKGTIEFDNPAVAKGAEAWMPRIVDAWLRAVHGLAQRGHFDGAGVDPDLLKRQLLEAAKGALGGGGEARDVLLTQAFFTRAH